MGAFLVNDNLLTDNNLIREMWADHFEALGTPSDNAQFDNGFLDTVARGVQEIFISCTNDCTGALSQPLEYKEVAHICTNLKAGVSGVSIDYKHIRFAGPPLWKHLFQLYKKLFENCSVCESLKTGGTPHFSRVRVQKQTIRIIIGVKSMRWFFPIDLKTMYHKKGYFLICSLALKRG